MARRATRGRRKKSNRKPKANVARDPAIPPGMRTVTPYLVIRGASKAIEFYKKAFGATEIDRSPMPDGTLMHATIRIGIRSS